MGCQNFRTLGPSLPFKCIETCHDDEIDRLLFNFLLQIFHKFLNKNNWPIKQTLFVQLWHTGTIKQTLFCITLTHWDNQTDPACTTLTHKDNQTDPALYNSDTLRQSNWPCFVQVWHTDLDLYWDQMIKWRRDKRQRDGQHDL